jgi:pimeloyl-ACP methyl ester carboxylesterase
MVPAMNDPETRGFVDGPAGPIAWRRFGSGPPLVLINGYAGTKDDWDPSFLGALGESSTVFAPDNRAIGESGGDAAEISVEAMSGDVLAFMDAMDLGSADLVAWSMGGFVAQTVASLAPDRIEHLVLMATDTGGPDVVRRDPAVHAELLDHDGDGDERARRLLGLLFPPEFAAAVYDQVGEIVAAAQLQLPLETLRSQEAAMEAWYSTSPAARLEAIKAPAMIATGTLDVVIPPGNAELLADSLPGSWLARFPGGGHAFMAQEPLRLGAAINAFIGR